MPETIVQSRPSPLIWAAASLFFFLFTMFGHDMVSQAYVTVFNTYGRAVMESQLHIISVLLLLFFVIAQLYTLRNHKETILLYLAGTAFALFLVIATDHWLISTNVERIHYAQYAILAMMLRKWSGSSLWALTACLLAGAVDEMWQYAAYPWYTKYFDFNDILLNQAGAALGLLLPSVPRKTPLKRDQLRSSWIVLAAIYAIIASIVLLMAAGGWIAPYLAPEGDITSVIVTVQESPQFVLSFHGTTGAWEHTDYGRSYFILSWIQGLALTTLVWFASVIALHYCKTER